MPTYQLVAILHGQRVYSNKSIESMGQDSILFTDGSWCNVVTGETHQGSKDGFISINVPSWDHGSDQSRQDPQAQQAQQAG
jgi:hypothetical protein